MKLIGIAEGALPPLELRHELWPADDGSVFCAWPRGATGCAEAERRLAGIVTPLLRVREVVHWDALGAPDADTVAMVCFVRRRRGMSYADFERHYRERHAPLAREHHPGIARYVQNFLAAPDDAERAVDAVSELWFRSAREHRERFYRDAASERVVAEDVARFLEPRAGLVRLSRPGAPPPPRS